MTTINTNFWNRVRYTLYAPFYDRIVRLFEQSRQRSLSLLQLLPGETVLLVGAGTGADLAYIPSEIKVTAVDLTPAMVEHLKSRAQTLQLQIDARVMDGQALDFADNAFDAVVLHLILAVIPDPYACIREATRVLKPGGRMVIFDKFLQDNQQPGMARRLLNVFANTIFSDVNRQLRPLIATVALKKVHEEETAYVRLGYRITLLEKVTDE